MGQGQISGPRSQYVYGFLLHTEVQRSILGLELLYLGQGHILGHCPEIPFSLEVTRNAVRIAPRRRGNTQIF